MTETAAHIDLPPPFPDHTQLPESDGTFVKNFQEHPQSVILTDSIGPILQKLHPDGDYAIGQDCGIYWRETEPPEKGAEAPREKQRAEREKQRAEKAEQKAARLAEQLRAMGVDPDA